MSIDRFRVSQQLSSLEEDIKTLKNRLKQLEAAEFANGAIRLGLSVTNDSNFISFKQAGTNISRALNTHLADWISAKDFGAKGDGNADDTSALQAAIDYLGTLNGGNLWLNGSFKISSTLNINYPNINILGYGTDGSHNTGSQGSATSTKLIWAGANGGTMVSYTSVSGVNNQKYAGGGISNVFFSSGVTTNGTGASYGLTITSYDQGVFENLFFNEFQTKGIRLTTIANLFDPRDPQHNRFINCWSRNNINVSGGLVELIGDSVNNPTGGSGGTYVLANVSLNHFENCGAIFLDGIAYEFGNSDHNFFINCRANRSTGGIGQGIVFSGSNIGYSATGASADSETFRAGLVARKNVFIGFSGGNVIDAKGTSTYTYPSFKNIFLCLDDSNNTPYPSVDTGALVYVTMCTNGVQYYNNNVALVSVNAGTLAGAEDMAIDARTRVVNESLRLENRASDGLRIARPTADNSAIEAEWLIAPNANQNLNLSRISGTGHVTVTLGLFETPAFAVDTTTLTSGVTLSATTRAVILVNATASSVTLTLPRATEYATSRSGQLCIRRIDTGANTVTIQRQSADTLNGSISDTIAINTGKIYVCDATSSWFSF